MLMSILTVLESSWRSIWRSNCSSELIWVILVNLCDSVRICIDVWRSKLILVISINLCDSVRISTLIFVINRSLWFCEEGRSGGFQWPGWGPSSSSIWRAFGSILEVSWRSIWSSLGGIESFLEVVWKSLGGLLEVEVRFPGGGFVALNWLEYSWSFYVILWRSLLILIGLSFVASES